MEFQQAQSAYEAAKAAIRTSRKPGCSRGVDAAGKVAWKKESPSNDVENEHRENSGKVV